MRHPTQVLLLICGCWLGLLLPTAVNSTTAPAPPAETLPTPADVLQEVIVQTTEPRFVAPTRRDRIGRIWAPVLIDGKGPYRMVLDTGATGSAISARAMESLDIAPGATTRVTGFTGTTVVPTIHVNSMEVGDLLMGPSDLPVLMDVFGGAQGVLGIDGLHNTRVYADFGRDRLEISRSRGERPRVDFRVVPLRQINGLLVADVRVGSVHAKAIIDTGAEVTVGNLALRDALMRRVPGDAQREDVIGVTLDVQSADAIATPDIDFGRLKITGVNVSYGDMYLFHRWEYTTQPTLAVGMDVLGSFDVLVIDYTRRELQILPR
jgi:predicted aspartyl protease